jgi:hypothetical protein
MLDYVKHHYNVTLKEANDCIWNRYGLPDGVSGDSLRFWSKKIVASQQP